MGIYEVREFSHRDSNGNTMVGVHEDIENFDYALHKTVVHKTDKEGNYTVDYFDTNKLIIQNTAGNPDFKPNEDQLIRTFISKNGALQAESDVYQDNTAKTTRVKVIREKTDAKGREYTYTTLKNPNGVTHISRTDFFYEKDGEIIITSKKEIDTNGKKTFIYTEKSMDGVLCSVTMQNEQGTRLFQRGANGKLIEVFPKVQKAGNNISPVEKPVLPTGKSTCPQHTQPRGPIEAPKREKPITKPNLKISKPIGTERN